MRSLTFALLTLTSTSAFAGPDGVVFPAWPNVASGANGTATAQFEVEHAVPINSARLIPVDTFDDQDFQYFWMPLTLPLSDATGRIAAVTVCYRVISASASAYISQTRLTEQLVPGSASIRLDDLTDRRHRVGECYTVTPTQPLAVNGIYHLGLKVVMGDLDDVIEVSGGMVRMIPR